MKLLTFPRLLVGTLLFVAVGCGPDARPQIQGAVSYQGNPIGNQTLKLHMVAEKQADSFFHAVRIEPDGTFKGDAPAPGNYKVVIELPLSALEGKAPADTAKVPQKYRDLKTSDLSWTIERGLNKKDFTLLD